MRDVAQCFVPPKTPSSAILVVDVKHFKKSSKCFAAEWEMCLPHLKAWVGIDDKINFPSPVCSSVLPELLDLLPRHVFIVGNQRFPFGYRYLSTVLWGKTCVSLLRLLTRRWQPLSTNFALPGAERLEL